MTIAYTIEETNRLGACRSRLLTFCPWHSLAEFMVKAHFPMGIPPGVRIGDEDLKVEASAASLFDGEPWLQVYGSFKLRGEVMRQLRIRSFQVDETSNPIYASFTAAAYRDPDYAKSVSKMAARIFKFCIGDIQFAHVLALYASRDAYHPFWTARVAGRSFSI
ncbi:hypothetical protein HNP46_000126 [Pseudomonas nitritireducens]|uniref:Uncharacterized protein n=1 Tax=Pseudomonas nitroreducens TaxID=46680 RepID=A0A7W7KF11_PSENT|nr:hypothetical protein [Pseudomonas nitritireducens]MBB4861315.1 hypothetical protein [Pseudomonas nitritireducens]